MNHLVSRRLIAASLALAWVPVHAAEPRRPLRQWLLGEWQSDAQSTLASLHFQGQSLSPGQREKVAGFFGSLHYSVTPTEFRISQGEHSLLATYVVASETDSTITLRFPRRRDMPDFTLYRVSEQVLFIRWGDHLEYFLRTAA